jgi:tRNA A37 threonylcarbamoyladenosine synthetase subunit TsaC/SUA5/YrdC
MLRAPLSRTILAAQSTCRASLLSTTANRSQSNAPAKAPEKIEVFIDDQPVQVLPGTTVLQVISSIFHHHIQYNIILFRQQLWLVLKFQDSAIMNV